MNKEKNRENKNDSKIIDEKMMMEWYKSSEYKRTRFFEGMANLRGWLIFGIIVNIIFSFILLIAPGETDYVAKLSIIGLLINLFIFILFIAMYYLTFALELFIIQKDKDK